MTRGFDLSWSGVASIWPMVTAASTRTIAIALPGNASSLSPRSSCTTQSLRTPELRPAPIVMKTLPSRIVTARMRAITGGGLAGPRCADRVAALLAHRAAGALLLVVVDQLEELFTLASAAERAAFLAALRALRAEPRCAVVFTLRADFFGALMESDLRAERRGQLSRIEVSPLRGEALAESVAERRAPWASDGPSLSRTPAAGSSTVDGESPCNSFALLDTRLSWADHARHLPPQGCHAHSPQ